MTELLENQTYVYCYHPGNRFAYVYDQWIEAEADTHGIVRHIVDVADLPEDPSRYTYDGSTWALIDGVDDEVALFNLRAERNRKIAETDWWASSDLTMTDEQALMRQRLRDVTDHFQSLEEVEWPELGQEVWPTPPYQPGT